MLLQIKNERSCTERILLWPNTIHEQSTNENDKNGQGISDEGIAYVMFYSKLALNKAGSSFFLNHLGLVKFY